MSNRNYTEELQQSMQKLLELERAFYQDGFTEEKEHMKRKIQYMKETILELETILNETIQQDAQPVVAQSSAPTVNETPQPIKEEENLVAMTIPTEEIQEEALQVPVVRPTKEPRPPKVPRTPSPVELFLKNNLKLLIFASFLVIGIVWLFVYVTSLSELSKELRVLAGFGVSVALISTAHVKKLTGNRAIALILVGYVVGLLVLLFGTIVLGVVPQLLAVFLSVLYVGYGLSQIIRLQAVVYDVSIILTSFLLTFAYRYVDAPHIVLYTYIALLLVSLTILLRNKGRLVSQYALILFSLAVTTIIGIGYDDDLYEQNLFGKFDHSFEIQLNLIFPAILLVLSSLSALFAKNEGENRWYPLLTGALYVAFFGYVFRMDALFMGEEIIFPFYLYAILAGLSAVTYVFAHKKQNAPIRNVGIVSFAVSFMYALTSLDGHVSSSLIMLATSFTLYLMFYVGAKDKLYTLRAVTLIYTFTTLNKAFDLLQELELNGSNALLIGLNVLVLAGVFIAAMPLLLQEEKQEQSDTRKLLWVVLAKGRILLHALLTAIFIHTATSSFLIVYEQPEAYRIGIFAVVGLLLYVLAKRLVQVELMWFTYSYLWFTALRALNELDYLHYETSLTTFTVFLVSVLTISFTAVLLWSKRPAYRELSLYATVQPFIETIHRTGALILTLLLGNSLAHTIDVQASLENGLTGFVAVLLSAGLLWRGIVKQEVLTKLTGIIYSIVVSALLMSYFDLHDFEWQHMLQWKLLNVIGMSVVLIFSVRAFANATKKELRPFPSEKPMPERNIFNHFLHRTWLPIAFLQGIYLIDVYASQLVDVNTWSENWLIATLLLVTLGGWVIAKRSNRFTMTLLVFFYSIRTLSATVDNISTWGEKLSPLVGLEVLFGFAFIGLMYILGKQVHTQIQQRPTGFVKWIGNGMMIGYLIELSQVVGRFGSLLETHLNSEFVLLSPYILVALGAFYVLAFVKKDVPHYKPMRWFVELWTGWIILTVSFSASDYISWRTDTSSIGMVFVESAFFIGLLAINYLIINHYQKMKLETIFISLTERTIYWLSVPFTLLTINIGMHLLDTFLFQSENITANGIVGLSIVYLLYEIAKAEKIVPKVKGVIISLYTLTVLYMSYLIFVLLAETSFIVRALIFIAIGVYGLFTALKKNK